MLAPIVLFVYNRPEHTRKTLESLMANDFADQSTLFIYADGPKYGALAEGLEKVKRTREIIREKQWCKEVRTIESEKNKGLANSVINGVTEIVNKFGKVIVLEDDLVLSKKFLTYMNEGLDRYESDGKVMQISGYMFPVKLPEAKVDAFFLPFTSSWGWATWKRAWDFFDPDMKGLDVLQDDAKMRKTFDLNGSYPYFNMLLNQKNGKVDSWAIRFYLSVFMKNGLVLFPRKTLVKNIGFDGSGVHCKSAIKQPEIDNFFKVYSYDKILVREEYEKKIYFFLKGESSIRRRIISILINNFINMEKKYKAVKKIANSIVILRDKLFLALKNDLKNKPKQFIENPENQKLDMYWDEEFANVLETWGEKNVWLEIQMLLINCSGKILDVACGTGRTIEILKKYPNLDVHGFDISEYLLEKAENKGIKREKLKAYDAIKTGYSDNFFDYSYSIGSLEHFTQEGIAGFLEECSRYTKIGSFHMIPVSRSGKDDGWLELKKQSFFNNSEEWWLQYFSKDFTKVFVINSKWEDDISLGKWFLCYK